MGKIIKIEGSIVLIGNDDGSIREVRLEDCSDFVPQIGDLVEVYNTETRTIVTKKEQNKDNNTSTNGAINITVSNSQQGMPAYTSTQNTKAVNKVAYCLIALFLGGFGIHKFYTGKIGMGILYLLFCWTYIPAIVSLVEFIIALCKPADANGNILV